jgi:hypothetical protein
MDILAKAAEQRLTLAPIYVPDTTDRHQEWASAAELEKAVMEFSRSGNRTVRLQHQHGTAIGTVESAFVWPYEHEAEILNGRGLSKGTRCFPAGTAFAWVRWSSEAWQAIKNGRIKGLSMGGRAQRLHVEADGGAAVGKSSGGWGRRLVAGQTIQFR